MNPLPESSISEAFSDIAVELYEEISRTNGIKDTWSVSCVRSLNGKPMIAFYLGMRDIRDGLWRYIRPWLREFLKQHFGFGIPLRCFDTGVLHTPCRNLAGDVLTQPGATLYENLIHTALDQNSKQRQGWQSRRSIGDRKAWVKRLLCATAYRCRVHFGRGSNYMTEIIESAAKIESFANTIAQSEKDYNWLLEGQMDLILARVIRPWLEDQDDAWGDLELLQNDVARNALHDVEDEGSDFSETDLSREYSPPLFGDSEDEPEPFPDLPEDDTQSVDSGLSGEDTQPLETDASEGHAPLRYTPLRVRVLGVQDENIRPTRGRALRRSFDEEDDSC